jgi:hypothetical protein
MSEEHARERLLPHKPCDERSSDGPIGNVAAGPERADEGGGPTPGDLEGDNVLRSHT